MIARSSSIKKIKSKLGEVSGRLKIINAKEQFRKGIEERFKCLWEVKQVFLDIDLLWLFPKSVNIFNGY